MYMDKEINNNGYDYVDLGLPSDTLWATCNIGANKPSESGLYFQWGDTAGYTKDKIGIDKEFTWDEYKFSINGSNTDFSKYITEGEILALENDAAHINMGGDWHMPSPKQIGELLDNTIAIFETLDGVSGMKFMSKNAPSKFIFIPAAGYAWDSFVGNSRRYGYVWASMLSVDYAGSGQILEFGSIGTNITYSNRFDGLTVRGVIG